MNAELAVLCAFSHVDSITARELEGDDIGALDQDETGWIGYCRCGHRSRIRYSPVAAQSEVAEHILGGINEPAR